MSRPDSWGTDRLDAFLAAVSDTRLEAAWHLLAFAPLRVRELLALRWAEIDTRTGRICVRYAVTGVPYAALAVPPGHVAARSIVLDPVLTTVLDRHNQRQQAERSEWGGHYVENGLVVCRENGRPLHPREMNRAFLLVMERSGISSIGLCDLRGCGRVAAARRQVTS